MNLKSTSKKITPIRKIEQEGLIGKRKFRLREIQTKEAEQEIKEAIVGNKPIQNKIR